MIKYIFLDIDGVIATPRSVIQGLWGLTPECQVLLEDIVSKTEAKIVLSSSWRKYTLEDTREYMNQKGFTLTSKIVGITIRGYHYIQKGADLPIPRGVEIKQWVDSHLIYPWDAYPECEEYYSIYDESGKFNCMKSNKFGKDFNYIILDDDTDMLLDHKDLFINTDSMIGLTRELADICIQKLNQYD